MARIPYDTSIKVSNSGAAAGLVLRGYSPSNQGLRLRIDEEQKRGQSGPITGTFVILDVGDNMHSDSLVRLLQRRTTAEEVRDVIRKDHPGCVNVSNANILSIEESLPVA